MSNKNTESKDKQKEKDKRARSITSKAEFKNVEIHNEILEQQVGVSTPGSVPSTLTMIQLRNGTIKAHYGERHGRPASNTD